MIHRFSSLFTRLERPLAMIEYVISVVILSSTAIAVIQVFSEEKVEDRSSLAQLIDQYQVVATLFCVMSAFAVFDLISISIKDNSVSRMFRSVATFAYTTGFFFISILTVLSFGFIGVLWVNELALSAISAILYLSLRVNFNNADRR